VKVLDSDHCVALLRGRLDLRSKDLADETLAVTAISVGELMHGVHKSAQVEENLARLGVLLAHVTVLSYDERAARQFGRLKAQLERSGQRLSDLDLQIASVAQVHDSPLVTHNQRHFERIPGLALEDWLTDRS
jgi:tRNA(fMet)-specific endonuclease VapC